MSQYLVLLYEDETAYAAASQEVMGEIYQDHLAFQKIAKDSLRGGNALQPTSTATAIRKRDDGGFTVTDAPFAEAKEALGGYYLLEAPDLDAAIALAEQVPARFGGVEVRPIMTFE
ncbi:YciI family protein [Nocardia sp. NPDC049190]|uniref:YciI family protein n=1 Tax=Nocardia sp. NPDC049190 TaxID=3155650 RepID=UPI0033F16DE3